MERESCANSRYSRRECLEIPGILENIENKYLENLTLQIFDKIDINLDTADVEGCHWVKPQGSKKVIIKTDVKMPTRSVLKKRS